MTELGWWYTLLFLVIIAVFYGIGFWAGRNQERSNWEDKEVKKEVVKKR